MNLKNITIVLTVLATSQVAVAQACDSKGSLRQGMAFANMNDFNGAINEFKASIKCRNSAAAYSNLGAAYLQVGKNNLALEALQRAERLDKRDSVVLYNLAAAYSIQDQTDRASVYLDKALSNGFNNYDAIRFDPDLTNLRAEPEFRETLEKHKVFIQ